MQLERKKVKGYTLLCLFKLYQTSLNAATYTGPALQVVKLATTNIHSMKR